MCAFTFENDSGDESAHSVILIGRTESDTGIRLIRRIELSSIHCVVNFEKHRIHAVLLLVSAGSEFSPKDVSAVEFLKKFFGRDRVYSDYVIVVFAGGDDVIQKTAGAKNCREQMTVGICVSRWLWFDIETKDECKKSGQIWDLVERVKSVVYKNPAKQCGDELHLQLSQIMSGITVDNDESAHSVMLIGRTESDTGIRILRRIGLSSIHCVVNLEKHRIHAVLLVVPASSEFSPKDISAAEFVQKFFGRAYTDYVIVVYARGDDQFKKLDYSSKHYQHELSQVQKTVGICVSRWFRFDIETKDECKKSGQIWELLERVKSVVYNSKNPAKQCGDELHLQLSRALTLPATDEFDSLEGQGLSKQQTCEMQELLRKSREKLLQTITALIATKHEETIRELAEII